MADAPDPANNQPRAMSSQGLDLGAPSGGQFANINRPISGATHEKELPVGKHPLQLYSLGTPNGDKVTIMLEELLAAGHAGAEYDAWLIRIGEGDQFSSGFVAVNPNRKIPALMDRIRQSRRLACSRAARSWSISPRSSAPSCPRTGDARAATMNWLMWQMGSAPFVGGGFGHFYAYAPFKIEYPINRYAMEDQAPAPRARYASRRATNIWRATNIRSPTWRSGPGMAAWHVATAIPARPSS